MNLYFICVGYLVNPSTYPLRPLCREEPRALEHWLDRWPKLDTIIQGIFFESPPTLRALITHPTKVLAMAGALVLKPYKLRRQLQLIRLLTSYTNTIKPLFPAGDTPVHSYYNCIG